MSCNSTVCSKAGPENPELFPSPCSCSIHEPETGLHAQDWSSFCTDNSWQRMAGWHHWLNGHEFEQTPGDGEGQGSLACFRPWAREETEQQLWQPQSKNLIPFMLPQELGSETAYLGLGLRTQPKPMAFQLRSQTWFSDLTKFRFLMSYPRKNSVRDKVIAKK